MKCEEFQKVLHDQEQVNLIPESQMNMHRTKKLLFAYSHMDFSKKF